jgi:RNA polymerase sigma-70 factor, ECF subfamily
MRGDRIPKDHAEEVADCFTAYAQDLFGYACVVTRGDSALADDLVQSAFIEAARQWPTMRGLRDAQRVRWLQTTVSYQAISMFRRKRCWRAIQALPPQQHAVAVMRWLLAMTNTEIAARLGIADGTVAAHLSAVRGKLRASLGPYDPFGDGKDGKGASS